jgi:large subunit ribosomal protein L13
LRGTTKAISTPHQEVGDYVIIVNAKEAIVTGRKKSDKMYYNYSGFLGGMKSENYDKLINRKPTVPMERAIKGMLPKGALGNKLFTNVKVYAGMDHPHAAQQPTKIEM